MLRIFFFFCALNLYSTTKLLSVLLFVLKQKPNNKILNQDVIKVPKDIPKMSKRLSQNCLRFPFKVPKTSPKVCLFHNYPPSLGGRKGGWGKEVLGGTRSPPVHTDGEVYEGHIPDHGHDQERLGGGRHWRRGVGVDGPTKCRLSCSREV